MRKLNTKHNLFQFRDGSIIDVTKIDIIKESQQDDEKAIIYISGTQMSIDKDDEFEKLVETWDFVKRTGEQDKELALKYLESAYFKIGNILEHLLKN